MSKEATKLREEMAKKHAKQQKELDEKIRIAEMLPDDLTVSPTITISHAPKYFGGVAATVSFSSPAYDPDNTWDPVAVLRRMEEYFDQVPMTVVRFGQWRRTTWPSAEADVPDARPEKRNPDKLKAKWGACPLWLIPCQHTNPDAQIYMVHKETGELIEVNIDVPRPLICLSAQRWTSEGTWGLVRGTAKLRYDFSSNIEHLVEFRGGAVVDTEQGMSGSLYFKPKCGPENWDMKASDFLELILKKK